MTYEKLYRRLFFTITLFVNNVEVKTLKTRYFFRVLKVISEGNFDCLLINVSYGQNKKRWYVSKNVDDALTKLEELVAGYSDFGDGTYQIDEHYLRRLTTPRTLENILVRKNRSFPPSLRFEIFKRDGFKCVYCGRNPKEDGIKLHIDHVIPKSKNGKETLSNLVTACSECNIGKKDIFLDDLLLKIKSWNN